MNKLLNQSINQNIKQHLDVFGFNSSDNLDTHLNFSTPGFSFESSNQKPKSRKVSDELKISIQDSNFSEDSEQLVREGKFASFSNPDFFDAKQLLNTYLRQMICEDSKDHHESKKREAKHQAKQGALKDA